MRFGPVTIKDKLGREIILRSAEVSDGTDLVQYLKVTASETPFLIRELEEVTITVQQETAFLENKINDERELMLIATLDGKHIGNCSVMSLGSYKRYSHRCDIAIALYKEYWGVGIGKAMLETALDIARNIGYEQAELEVIADNKSAISLYEKLGFVKYGEFPNNMKYSDGSYANAYWMMKKL